MAVLKVQLTCILCALKYRQYLHYNNNYTNVFKYEKMHLYAHARVSLNLNEARINDIRYSDVIITKNDIQNEVICTH